MSPRRVFVYGAGGHGKVVADALLASGEAALEGFLDDGPGEGRAVLGLPVWRSSRLAEALALGPVSVALGVGDNAARRRVAERCEALGAALLTVVHPRAAVAPSARLGAGAVVMACAAINPEAVVGRGAIVNTGAVVEHDCVVGDYAHLSPRAALAGAARVGEGAHVGTGAVLLPRASVGSDAVVGAGAVVLGEVPDGVTAVGVPARVIRRRGT